MANTDCLNCTNHATKHPTWVTYYYNYRSAPEIVTLYAANLPATAIRAKIRQRFEQNKFVDDLQAVDVLLAKSYMDYQETMNAWKMDSHLMRMFNDEEVSQNRAEREHTRLALAIRD